MTFSQLFIKNLTFGLYADKTCAEDKIITNPTTAQACCYLFNNQL